MTNEEIAVRLDGHEHEIGSLKHRMDDVEKDQKALNDLTASVRELAADQGNMKEDIREIKTDVKGLTSIPGKRWNSLVDKLLAAVYGKAADIYLALGDEDSAIAILEQGLQLTGRLFMRIRRIDSRHPFRLGRSGDIFRQIAHRNEGVEAGLGDEAANGFMFPFRPVPQFTHAAEDGNLASLGQQVQRADGLCHGRRIGVICIVDESIRPDMQQFLTHSHSAV